MIKVNLLPPEYRKVDGTPIARFVTLAVGVFLTATAISVWGYVHMGMLAEVRDQRTQLEEELVGVKQLADRSQALLREFKEYQRRRETIEKIGASRILWSKKLDELADIVHNKGDQKRHLVWLESIRTMNGRTPASPVALQIRGWCGEEYHKLSDFHRDLRSGEDFFADCMGLDPPEGREVTFDDGFVPNEAWQFAFGIDLKQANWREKQ